MPARTALWLLIFALLSASASSQQPLKFDVASIRPAAASAKPSSNVPLGPGNVMGQPNGIFTARGFTLLDYIDFAWKVTDYQQAALREHAPAWATQERFTIEARTENKAATKDQLRLMMRTLLAERFHLAVHYETREVPVYALLQSGQSGSKLQPHPASSSCDPWSPGKRTPEGNPMPEPPEQITNGFPYYCGGILGLPASAPDRYSFGARNVPMSLIASALSSWGNLGRPVLDRTTLPGNWDFVLDYTPDPPPPNVPDSGGPTFQQALRQQLGLKLEPTRGPVQFLTLDHAERPTEN